MAPFRLRKNDTVYDRVERRVVDVVYVSGNGEYLILDSGGIHRHRKRHQLEFRHHEKEERRMALRLREGDVVQTREGYVGRICGGPIMGEYLVDYDSRPMEWRYRVALKLIKTRAEAAADRKERNEEERRERRMKDLRRREEDAYEQRSWSRKDFYIHHEGRTHELKAGTMVRYRKEFGKDVYHMRYCDMEWVETAADFARGYETELQRAKNSMLKKTPNPAHHPQEKLEWFDVIARKDHHCGIEEGDMVEAARCDAVHGFVVKVGGNHTTFFGGAFIEYFARYDINDYARELKDVKQHEVDAALEGIYEGGIYVGAELYGYPPEEENQEASRIAELEAQIKELKRQKNDADYGVVAECYLWEIEYEVPHRWGGGKSERIAEILTTQRNMAEAGIAAEATAKDDGLDAVVTMIKYKRRIFRTK